MTPDERFGLILLAITIGMGMIGWLIRQMIGAMRGDTAENTAALQSLDKGLDGLTKEFSDFRLQLANERAATAEIKAAEATALLARRRRAGLRGLL